MVDIPCLRTAHFNLWLCGNHNTLNVYSGADLHWEGTERCQCGLSCILESFNVSPTITMQEGTFAQLISLLQTWSLRRLAWMGHMHPKEKVDAFEVEGNEDCTHSWSGWTALRSSINQDLLKNDSHQPSSCCCIRRTMTLLHTRLLTYQWWQRLYQKDIHKGTKTIAVWKLLSTGTKKLKTH